MIINILTILLIIYIYYKSSFEHFSNIKQIKPKDINVTINKNKIIHVPEKEKLDYTFSYNEINKAYDDILKEQKEFVDLVNDKYGLSTKKSGNLICYGGYENLSPDFWN